MKVLAIILAGGRGSRLDILSEQRVKPSVPFAGKYRIIDFTLSNCTNSGLYDIAIMTQYIPFSLNDHIGSGKPWDLDRRDTKVTLLQPHDEWYKGTADSVKKNMHYIKKGNYDYILILSGDHIYKMNYMKMIKNHIENQAELTVGCNIIDPKDAHHFGMMKTDEQLRITDFVEKPQNSKLTLASMGIYVFNKDSLIKYLEEIDEENLDFGKHVIPRMVSETQVFAYKFKGYWKDVGTYDAYLNTNLGLIETVDKIQLDMYDPTWKIYTRSEEMPSAKIGSKAKIKQALISNGSIVAGEVTRSVISPGVVIHPLAVVKNSVILNDVEIKPGAIVENCIIDKHTIIEEGAMVGFGEDMEPNIERPDLLSTGITVVGKSVRIPKNMVVGRNVRIFGSANLTEIPENIVYSGSTIK
jgi:glucose-1-phosphate adenylyltransferase